MMATFVHDGFMNPFDGMFCVCVCGMISSTVVHAVDVWHRNKHFQDMVIMFKVSSPPLSSSQVHQYGVTESVQPARAHGTTF